MGFCGTAAVAVPRHTFGMSSTHNAVAALDDGPALHAGGGAAAYSEMLSQPFPHHLEWDKIGTEAFRWARAKVFNYNKTSVGRAIAFGSTKRGKR